MNMSKIFTQAHALTKATIKSGDCYKVNFGAAIKEIIAERKKVIKVTLGMESMRITNRWNVKNYSYVANETALISLLQSEGISAEKIYVDMNEGEFCFKGLRTYGSFELAKKLGVRGVAKFEGTEVEMYEKALSVTKAFLNAARHAYINRTAA